MTTPRLSVIIPWADRVELDRTLAHNRDAFAAADAEVIIVCCGGDRETLARCLRGRDLTRVRALAIATGFNKALAINLGAYHARAETLFLLDADIELAPDTCAAALACVSERRAVVLDRVVESSPTSAVDYPYVRSVVHTFELETSAGEVVRVETNRQRLADGSRSAPGMVFVPKRCFEDVGGMNSDLTGWGWEDLDLLVRLQLGARMEVARAGAATHLTHGDDVRRVDGTSRAANEARNATMCVANYGLGHYLGTYDDDVATWLPKD